MNNQNYVFCNIYFPSTNSNLADFNDTLTCLNAVCTQIIYREEHIIIAGDFNVHVSDPRSGQREHNRGKLLLEMFAEFDKFPVNVDMACMGPLFTYYSSCGNSVVDYIFASRNIERTVKC
jgi:endonuclease/exonuclease/phosphatase family metal-dependent hydrolase